MSLYSIFWKSEAQDSLAELWLASADGVALANAANQVDRLLRGDPHRYGVALHEDFWALNVPPLRVIYEINEQDASASVVRVALL